MFWLRAMAAALALPLACGCAAAQRAPVEPTRNGGPNASFASSIIVPSGCTTVYLPGTAAWDPGTPLPGNPDTEAQTAAAIENIKGELEKVGFSLSDVVQFRAVLVPDPARGNKIDFAGYSRAYKRYFGSADQPKKPVRATYEGALVVPGLLVEIEVVAAGRCKRK